MKLNSLSPPQDTLLVGASHLPENVASPASLPVLQHRAPDTELPRFTARDLRHKHPAIDHYLNGISGNIDEKSFVLQRIKERLSEFAGPPTVLEIGVGGGECLENMLETANQQGLKGTKFIGIDIDQTVIDKALDRHQALRARSDEGNLSFVCDDAKNLDHIPNDSVDCINASAVVHEIYSYGGGQDAISQFFHSCLRVLKPGGELIYRDPLSPCKPEEFIKLISMSQEAKMFSLFFVPFFFAGRNALEDVDNVMHDTSTLRQLNESVIKLSRFNGPGTDGSTASTRCELSMAKFLDTPLDEIDMDKGITFNCGNLAATELTRHFTVLCKELEAAGLDVGKMVDLKQTSKREGLLVKDFPAVVQEKPVIGNTLKAFLNREGVESYYYAGSEQVSDYANIQSEDGYTFCPVIDKTIVRDSYNRRLGNHFSMNTVGDYELNKVLDGKRLLVLAKTAVDIRT